MKCRAALIALLLLPAAAHPADPQAQAFVEALVAAMNSKDAARRKALLHPDSLRCATADSDAFLEEQFARQARRPIPADITWSLTPAPPGQPLFADKLDYPVRPTHRLLLDFSSGAKRSTTMVLQLARYENSWREVSACPKPDTVAAARAASQARAQHREKLERLMKGSVVEVLEEGLAR